MNPTLYARSDAAKRGADRILKAGKNPNGKTKFVIKPHQGKFMIDWLSDEMAEFASNEAVKFAEDEPEVEVVTEVEVVDIETPTDSVAIVQVTQAVTSDEEPEEATEVLPPWENMPHTVTDAEPNDADSAADLGISTDGRRGKGRKKQGVLDMIERMLTDPSYNDGKGVTLNDMVTEIAAETGRPTEHITATVKTQLSRMPKTRNLRIKRERIDNVLYYNATHE